MSKFILLLIVLLFISSCSSMHKTVEEEIKDSIKVSIKEIPVKELIIVEKTNYLLSPLFVALFTGVVLLSLGIRTIGVGIIAASIVCIVLIITLSLYTKIIALIGIGVLITGLIFLGKKIYDQNKFEKEMINSVEIAKDIMTDEEKEELKIELDIEQSDKTQEIVKKIKGEI